MTDFRFLSIIKPEERRIRLVERDKSIPEKRVGKRDREKKVLLGLVDYFIKTGKPVGSNTLKDAGFGELSSATIRNYFAHLEEEGFLSQSHASGGRIPTPAAYRFYASEYLNFDPLEVETTHFDYLKQFDSREIAKLLQEGAETLSQTTQCAVFLSAPRFDHDYVADIKLVPIDVYRCLCILITDFGVIQTEMLQLPTKLSSFGIKRIEQYFQSRLKGLARPENLEPEEESLAQGFYNEVMLRYIVGYSNFMDEDLYRTGFSRLLTYPDFHEASLLASSLSLFENTQGIRLLLRDCCAHKRLMFWIGDDLNHYTPSSPNCMIMTIPYYINAKVVGAFGLLGPIRLPYRQLFSLMRVFSQFISDALTRNIYKFKISFRQPEKDHLYLQKEERRFIGQSRCMLLEDKREI